MDHDHQQYSECDVIHGLQVVFEEINSSNLTVITGYQTNAKQTIVLNFQHPLTLYAPVILGCQTL